MNIVQKQTDVLKPCWSAFVQEDEAVNHCDMNLSGSGTTNMT